MNHLNLNQEIQVNVALLCTFSKATNVSTECFSGPALRILTKKQYTIFGPHAWQKWRPWYWKYRRKHKVIANQKNCRFRLLIFKVHVEKDLEGINVSCKLTIDFS